MCVHVIDERSSPGAGGMWRWAVHIGRDFADKESCLNAGAEPTRDEALLRGQAVAVAAARVADRCGVLHIAADQPNTVELDHDPCGDPWPFLYVKEI